MKYTELKSPEDLLKFMAKQITYGVFDKDSKTRYLGDDKDFGFACENLWKLSSPNELLKNGVGHCWDQVELERDFFKRHGYKFKTFFIWFNCKRQNKYPTHTYLVYEDKKSKEWCWFEHSDYANKGIHKFDSLNEAIEAQKIAHINYAKSYRKSRTDVSKIQIFEYDNVPDNIGMTEFMDYIFRTGKII